MFVEMVCLHCHHAPPLHQHELWLQLGLLGLFCSACTVCTDVLMLIMCGHVGAAASRQGLRW
jgi:hypothetical protein